MILNFTKVGPTDWNAWHRGVLYVITCNDGWILAVDGKVQARPTTRGDAVALANSIASLPASTMKKNKWQHDGADRNESWWYGPPDCEPSEALGVVSPQWRATRGSGIGKPDNWIAIDSGGNKLGEALTRREATLIVERHVK